MIVEMQFFLRRVLFSMIGKITTTNVFFSFVSPVLPFHYSPLVVPHHGCMWPIYKLSVR